MRILERAALDRLIDRLAEQGFRVLGPTVREGAVVHDEIRSTADLPAGWLDDQDAGRYRLQRRADGAAFAHAVGPTSWKRFLFPPRERLLRIERDGDGIRFVAGPADAARPLAFFGVRPCDLTAIAVQDRVFDRPPGVDLGYRARRRDAFLVAVECTRAAATCFCDSTGSGPAAPEGADLVLTELVDRGEPRYLARAGSDRGCALLDELPGRPAERSEAEAAAAAVARAAAAQTRRLDPGARAALRRWSDARWQELGSRCLACGNCTMVCPTCFCSSVEDASALDGASAERYRVWDSCFSPEHSYVHGGAVRASTAARYRQWLTHKLSTWRDQFGADGCVGCGRCITWCPVGIDLVAEAAAFVEHRAAPGAPPQEGVHGSPGN
jgi:ferredoxin